MAVRVVSVAAPAVGHDWTFVVPGQWRANLIGVTATLSTPSGLTVYVDSSGGGHNSTLGLLSGANIVAQPGPYTGGTLNRSVFFADSLSPGAQYSRAADGFFTDEMFLNFHAELATAGNLYNHMLAQIGGNTFWEFSINTRTTAGAHGLVNPVDVSANVGGSLGALLAGAIPWNTWIHWAIRTNAVGGINFVDVLVNGVAIASNVQINGTNGTPQIWVGGFAGNVTYTAGHATFASALSDAQIAAHYAARTSNAAYKAAVLADTPSALWMLDEIGNQFNKQTNLVITDGTTTVATFPAGLASTPSNAATWSWQVLGTSSLQSSDGSINTVSIPELLLPAGYTVGTRTLDLAGTDQWGNIKVWFDDGTGGTIPGAPGTTGYLNALLVPDYSHRGG